MRAKAGNRILAALTMALAVAVPGVAQREKTVAPVYYLLDYGYNHLDNPEYIEWARQLPPDLLHFGKDVPMTHLFGPIQAVGGENQAHGRNRADIRRLTPAEVRERIATLQRMNKNLHGAGVKMVMPYIAAITMAGDPVKREGFFEFYDHWDEYREFGIGPKPKTNPETWVATKADGSLHTFGPDLAPAYYTGMNRYVNCIEHPDWRAWLKQVTRLCAVAGYDGVFPDNSSPVQCHSPYCQQGFRQFLSDKYIRAELKALFGTSDVKQISLPRERGSLLYVEAQRFYQTSLARHLREMRDEARKVNPKFQMFPNCGTPVHSAEYLTSSAEFLMLEGGSGRAEGAGCVVQPIIGDIVQREIEDNILEYRYVADLPGQIGLMILEMGPTPWTRKLCIAEAAAFGSGAYNGARPSSREVQWPFIAFVRNQRALYENKISSAQVGLLFFPMQIHYPGNRHWPYAFQLKNRLGSLQVPFDCFSETGLDVARLRTYRMIVAPDLRYLTQAQLTALQGYAEGGGRLVVVEQFATEDETMRPRGQLSWLPPAGQEAAVGKGTVVHLEALPGQKETLRLLEQAGVQRLVSGDPAGMQYPLLRVMMYETPGERVVHLLNYNAPIAAGAGPNVPLNNVRVRVPVGAGGQVAKVTCLDPEAEALELESEVRDGVCEFVVPEVALYKVCRVEMR